MTTPGDSVQELEEQARAIKDRYFASHEREPPSPDEHAGGHVYQVYIKVGQ